VKNVTFFVNRISDIVVSYIKDNTMKIFITILSFLFLFTACEEAQPEKPVLRVNFKLAYNGQEINLYDEVTDHNGDVLKFETLKVYVSDFEIDGNKDLEFPDVALIDFNSPDDRFVELKLEPGAYTKLDLGIGVTPDLNATDPSSVPDTDPLSANQAMYWTWASKYIFYKIEGRADTGTGSFDHFFLYHVGTDDLFRHTEELNINLNLENGDFRTVDVWVDLANVFEHGDDAVSIRDEFATHTLDHYDLAEKLADKFVDAFVLE
jgi:hypothetical protein